MLKNVNVSPKMLSLMNFVQPEKGRTLVHVSPLDPVQVDFEVRVVVEGVRLGHGVEHGDADAPYVGLPRVLGVAVVDVRIENLWCHVP